MNESLIRLEGGKYLKKIIIVITILFQIVGCNHDQESQEGQERNFEGFDVPQEQIVDNQDENHVNDNDFFEENLDEELEENTEINQSDYLESEITEHNNNLDLDNTSKIPPIYLNEFIKKWNELSEEYTADNSITSFETTVKEGEMFHYTYPKEFLQIIIYDFNNTINKIQIFAEPKTNNETFSMLTSWWQLILFSNPNREPFDVDQILAEMGIGPNGDLSNLKQSTFTFEEGQYKVRPNQDGYLFEVVFP